MPPDVNASLNANYIHSGNTLDKYTPLEARPPMNVINPVAVNAFMQKRIDTFKDLQASFRVLYFRGITDEEILNRERNTQSPPIVVVSSGRATWIKTAMNYGEQAFNDAGNNFNNTVGDTSIFKYGPVPFYFSKRYNQKEKRNFYIFVHQTEYEHYKTELAEFDITVIGWNSFRTINGWENTNIDQCLGFGMSRYVVFQFFKELNSRDTNLACKKIWMVDDNVCHITNFPGFSTIETYSDNNNLGGIGFGVENTQLPNDAFTDKIYKGKPYNKAISPEEDISIAVQDRLFFLQQAVLWNLKIIPEVVSFSPYFIGSNEDITFCRVLSKYQSPVELKLWEKTKILKSQTTQDTSQGLQIHNRLKRMVSATLSLEDNRSSLEITNNVQQPIDLFNYIDSGMALIQKQEPPYISYIKAGEQISRVSMYESGVAIFSRVPQACFVTSNISEFEIIRYK